MNFVPYRHWQETGGARCKRKYTRQSTRTQDKSISKISTQGALPQEPIDPAPDNEAMEAPAGQVILEHYISCFYLVDIYVSDTTMALVHFEQTFEV